MTQSESLRIKRTVTLFLLEVGYNEKIAQFLTIECLKKFSAKLGIEITAMDSQICHGEKGSLFI